MRDVLRLERVLGTVLMASASLMGCPVDDRALQQGGAGEAGDTTRHAGEGGASIARAGEGGGMRAGAGGESGEASDEGGAGGRAGAKGALANGGANASGSAGDAAVGCTGPKCSCFDESGDECGGKSCCDDPVVAGGDFSLGEATGSVSATVADHRLDRYEVSVGRFRRFVIAYAGAPQPESGQHPWVVASGWRSEWDIEMPVGGDALIAALTCDTRATFELQPGSADVLPVNCVTWYEAFAFCAWDGGRLPTEAEWEYAASGGSLDRSFPWGETAPSSTSAVFDTDELGAVGSKPAGAGQYQQLDLAGSLSEWVFDWFGEYGDPCVNCARAEGGDARVLRGGNYASTDSDSLRAGARDSAPPNDRSSTFGFRCARDL